VLGCPRRMEGVGGRLGPRPRPAAQARPMFGEGGERAFARSRASGCARPASSVGPAAILMRATFVRASAWNRVALTRALSRGCAAPP
jgi:hypothetical protein